MKNVIILGSGCAKCTKTAEKIQKVAQQHNVEITMTKETSPQAIMAYGVMQTPAVVIDEKVVSSGSVPQSKQIGEWLTAE